ncbi:MAG: acyltransferase [Prevotella sp.]|nr:acyltransferase [Prevotella sp.]
MKELLTRKECSAMRGVAILAIMLHNYCHWLRGIVRENEYTWMAMKNDQLWHALQNPDELLPMHLVSFFGHYGVPVFLFLSGFGLVKKYEQGQLPEISIWRFVRYNYLKLFRIFIVGFVAFIMLDAITPSMHRYQWTEVVGMIGMFANLFEDPSRVVWPGPYWYFSITLQLYIVYRLVFYRWRHWSVVVSLIAVCWLLQAGCQDDAVLLERLRYNLIGGMLPFGLGLMAAKIPTLEKNISHTGEREFPRWVYAAILLLASALILAMGFSFHSWLWIPALIVVGTIAVVKLMPESVLNVFVWLGGISAAIFVIHPLVRKIFVRPYLYNDMYAGLLLYVVATLLVAWIVKKVIDMMPSPKL